MITPGYSITATERIIPRLALDFTTGALDSRVTVTRALNTATCVNSSGYVEIVNANLPRFDHNPATLARRGLLIELTRSNLLKYSSQFDDPSWDKQGTTVTANATTSPDNTNTAYKIVPTNVNTVKDVNQPSISLVSGTTYAISAFAKKGEYNFLQLTLLGSASHAYANFNLDTGAVATTGNSPVAVSITPFSNGWYKCVLVATSAVTTTGSPVYGPISSNIASRRPSYAGDGSSGIYLWGAQFEVGGFVTSYIPTTTTSLTRNADVVTMTSTNFSSWWQATTGATTVRAQQISVAGTAPWLQFDDTTADNIIALRGNTTNPELYIKATTDQAQIDAGTIAASTNYGLTGAWNTNSCAASLNGAAAVTDTSATIPTVTQARLGSDGTNYLNGWLQSIRYWPQRITDAEAQAFSKL